MIKELLVIFFLFDYIPDWYKTQELCDRAGSDIPILIVHFPVKYVTQKMCDKTVDISLGILKIIPNWFVTKKWLKNSLLLFTQIKGYLRYKTILMKILAMLYLNVVIILMKMILILIFWSDFRLGILNLKNLRHLKVTSARKLFFVIKQRLMCN